MTKTECEELDAELNLVLLVLVDDGLTRLERLDLILAYEDAVRAIATHEERTRARQRAIEAEAEAEAMGFEATVDVAEAARRLDVDARTARRYARAGLLGAKKVGRAYRFPASEIPVVNEECVTCESGHETDSTL